jgi:hypothetical protein
VLTVQPLLFKSAGKAARVLLPFPIYFTLKAKNVLAAVED